MIEPISEEEQRKDWKRRYGTEEGFDDHKTRVVSQRGVIHEVVSDDGVTMVLRNPSGSTINVRGARHKFREYPLRTLPAFNFTQELFNDFAVMFPTLEKARSEFIAVFKVELDAYIEHFKQREMGNLLINKFALHKAGILP